MGKLGGYRGRISSGSGPVRGGSAILGQCPYPECLHLSSSQGARSRRALPAIHYQGQHAAHLAFCSPGFADCQACTACTEARVGSHFTMPTFYVQHMTCLHRQVGFLMIAWLHLFNGSVPLCNLTPCGVHFSQALHVLLAAVTL